MVVPVTDETLAMARELVRLEVLARAAESDGKLALSGHYWFEREKVRFARSAIMREQWAPRMRRGQVA